jgi:hypothetical protein
MHKRDTGQHVLTATITDDEKAADIQQWIDDNFGSDTAAVLYAINQQMERDT